MKFCVYCGNKIEDEAEFCPYCGKEIEENEGQDIEKKKVEEKQKIMDAEKPKETPAKMHFKTSKIVSIIVIVLFMLLMALSIKEENIDRNDYFNKEEVKQESGGEKKQESSSEEEQESSSDEEEQKEDIEGKIREKIDSGEELSEEEKALAEELGIEYEEEDVLVEEEERVANIKAIYEKMRSKSYEELYEMMRTFTPCTPGLLDGSFCCEDQVTETLKSGMNALKTYMYWKSYDFTNGCWAYYGSIEDSKPDGRGVMFHCVGLDADDGGSKEYVVIKGEWVEGDPQGEFEVYHSNYDRKGRYAVTYTGNMKDGLWDGDITMRWKDLSTGASDLAIIHATNGTFPVIRQEGTKCVYAESETGFYWFAEEAEDLIKCGICSNI